MNTRTYIQTARYHHGRTFNYSETKYENEYTKIKIKCRIHGIFETYPGSHLKTGSCGKCNSDAIFKKVYQYYFHSNTPKN
jgi:hypothetical protein